MTFEEFCESTGLHGWKYIGSVSKIIIYFWSLVFVLKVRTKERYIWLLIVIGALCVAAFFLFMAAKDFTSSTVVTTIETTTAPLSEVFFPTIILCSINQIRQSLFKVLWILTILSIHNVSSKECWCVWLPPSKVASTNFLFRNEPSINRRGDIHHTGYCYKVYIILATDDCLTLCSRPETVLKLQKHWHLISNTNTTDW